MEGKSREQELMDEIKILKAELSKYQKLASVVTDAEVWDYFVYDEIPDENWLAIDRKDYDLMLQYVHQLDQYKPWKSSMEKRLEHYR